MEKTFLHSGDMGDLIASICSMRYLGGGKLYIDTTGGINSGEYSNIIRMQSLGRGLKLRDPQYEFLRPLLEAQPYITSVEKYEGQKIDYDLNKFRSCFFSKDTFAEVSGNLFYMNCFVWNAPRELVYSPWVFVDGETVVSDRPIVAARSTRYHGGHIYWRSQCKALEQSACFLGTNLEHMAFQDAFEVGIPHKVVSDALEMAKIIKGSKSVIVNSTFVFWLALALGHKNIFHECCPDLPSSLFKEHPNIRNFIGMRCEKEKNK